MSELTVSTIGFTKTSAQYFFERLRFAGVKRVLDVRLNNTSQLSAFAKSNDLSFFLKEINGISYEHKSILAPTSDMLMAYKKKKSDWSVYENLFLDLMQKRKIEERLRPDDIDGSCLLCSEATPHHCHRRLVCDYLNGKWGGRLKVRHL